MIAGARGFTLIEVLIAAGVVAAGLAGFAAMTPGTSAALREGRELSGATFLAEERLEQVRGVRWTVLPDGVTHDCLGMSAGSDAAPASAACPTSVPGSTTFADERAGDIPAPFTQYGRTVRVRSCAEPGACPSKSDALRLVTVTVTYWPGSALGGSVTRRPLVVAALMSRS